MIGGAPLAQVVRAKNRLDDGVAAAAGGYRDVALNLRVATAAARSMGVDGHVCEVQLVLQSFHALKVRLHCAYDLLSSAALLRMYPGLRDHKRAETHMCITVYVESDWVD
jgi:hypothetical protein